MSEAKQSNITIAITPAGLHITCEYTGTLASIPAAIEQLRAAGIVELVKASQVCPHSAPYGSILSTINTAMPAVQCITLGYHKVNSAHIAVRKPNQVKRLTLRVGAR